jgi:2-polyprenyl-6-methoxyphenol hydroxylase-like FAD-dependent oxidoreductase
MSDTDVVIVGGGLAGSTAAAMLGRAGIAATIIDPHTVYPPDFRCEKLDASQIASLRKTGLAEAVFANGTLDEKIWVVRGGRVVDAKPRTQCNILYDTLVNTVRGEIPASVPFIHDKVTAVSASADRQTVTLASGETISARLVVFASGLNIALRHTLGIGREIISPNHSISLGFDIEPVGADAFPHKALTYFSERAADRMAYFTMFPIGATTRVNLFVYREMTDPWLEGFRKAPEASLEAIMPRLRSVLGDFKVAGFVKIRPVDLMITKNHVQPGFVLVGDAFSTSCPAAGTGTNKVFTDVERLCNEFIPRWLATPGMTADKIAGFYSDPEKVATEAFSRDKAFRLRALSTGSGLAWTTRRWGRFVAHSGLGMLRKLRGSTTGPAFRSGRAGEAARLWR